MERNAPIPRLIRRLKPVRANAVPAE
jgi:hypothetical protein